MADVQRSVEISVAMKAAAARMEADSLTRLFGELGTKASTALKDASEGASTLKEGLKEGTKHAQGFTITFEELTKASRDVKQGIADVGKAFGMSGEAARNLGEILSNVAKGDWPGVIINSVAAITAETVETIKKWKELNNHFITSEEVLKGLNKEIGELKAIGDLVNKYKELNDAQATRLGLIKEGEAYGLEYDTIWYNALKQHKDGDAVFAKALETARQADAETKKARSGRLIEIHSSMEDVTQYNQDVLDFFGATLDTINELGAKGHERAKKAAEESKKSWDEEKQSLSMVATEMDNIIAKQERIATEWAHFGNMVNSGVDALNAGARSVGNSWVDMWAKVDKDTNAYLDDLNKKANEAAKHLADEKAKNALEEHKKRVEDLGNAFHGVTSAVADMSLAIAEAGDGGLAAVHKQLKGEALRSAVMGAESLAVAGFDFAIGNFPGATAATIAAGQFAAVAALEGIGAAATSGASSGGGGAYGSGGAPAGGYVSSGSGGGSQHTTIVVNVGSQLATQKEVGDAVVKAVQSSYTGGGLANGTLMVRGARRTGG